MSLEQRITEDMKAAMKAQDKGSLEAIRAIRAAILNAKTEKGASDTLTADAEMKLLQRLQKQRKESAEIYTQQGRADLAEVELFQAGIIENYLPKQLSTVEVKAKLTTIIQELGASGPQDLGKVMGKATAALAGQADGKTISALAKELLS